MPLLAYNLTLVDINLFNLGLKLQAALALGVRGPATDVTGTLYGLSDAIYGEIGSIVATGQVQLIWTEFPEYEIPYVPVIDREGNVDVRFDTDIYLDPTYGDDAYLGLAGAPIRTLARWQELKDAVWRRSARLHCALGTVPLPKSLSLHASRSGSAADLQEWLGTMIDQCGALFVQPGSTSSALVGIGDNLKVRSGAMASVIAAIGAGQDRLTTVAGLAGSMGPGDCGNITAKITTDPGATAGAIEVDSTTGFNPSGGFAFVGTEGFFYSSLDATHFLGVQRGQKGIAAAHPVDSVVSDGSGRQMLFGLASHPGNNGTFQVVSFISADSVVIVNGQSVVENSGQIYWQDSWRGSFLRMVSPSTITVVAAATLKDGDSFSVAARPDVIAAIFEFSLSPGFSTTPGRVTINVMAADDVNQVAFKTIAAINAANIGVNAGLFGPGILYLQPSSGSGAVIVTENVNAGGFQVENVSAQDPCLVAGHGATAIGIITVVAKGNLTNNDSFFIPDGRGPGVTFEYKVTAGYVPVPGRTTIDVSVLADPSAASVALTTAATINTLPPMSLAVRATTDNTNIGGAVQTAKVMLDNMLPGSAGNLAIGVAVANGAFTVSGFTGGVGTSTTTFTLAGSGLIFAPSVGQEFVIEKPGTVFQYCATGTIIRGNKTEVVAQGIKFQGAGLTVWDNIDLLMDRCEHDLLGGTLQTINYANFGVAGALNTVNDQTVLIPQLGGSLSKFFIHNGQWNLRVYSQCLLAVIVSNHLSIAPQGLAFFNGDINGFRTTIAFSQGAASGAFFRPVMDGSLASTDVAIIQYASMCNGIMATNLKGASINNSPGYAISATTYARINLGTVGGYGNAGAGILLDTALGTVSANVSVTGGLGACAFGHAIPANIKSYVEIRTPDLAGVKGYTDAYGNRMDAG